MQICSAEAVRHLGAKLGANGGIGNGNLLPSVAPDRCGPWSLTERNEQPVNNRL